LRWIGIRAADIDPTLRQTFERHGVGTMQTLLAAHDRVFEHQGYGIDAKSVRDPLLSWLTEQYDREEPRRPGTSPWRRRSHCSLVLKCFTC